MSAEYNKKGITFRIFRAVLQTVCHVAAESRVNDILGLLRKSICDLQSSHPAKQANISALHADLENAVRDSAYVDAENEGYEAVGDVNKLLISLRLNILSSVHKADEIARTGIEEYFKRNSRKGAPLPRFSFKLLRNKKLVQDVEESINFVADISDENAQDFRISQHSLFQYVVELGGEARVQNRVPEAMRDDPNYCDPRINKLLASKYQSPSIYQRLQLLYKRQIVDQAWIDCFDIDGNGAKGNIQDPDRRSYYKSIMAIPITLIQGDYPAIEGSLFERNSESGKVILGFICVDHVYEDFFGEEDEHIGWIYSDIISFPLMDYFQYVVYSDVVKDAIGLLIRSGRSEFHDTIRRFLSDLHIPEISSDGEESDLIITDAPLENVPSELGK